MTTPEADQKKVNALRRPKPKAATSMADSFRAPPETPMPAAADKAVPTKRLNVEIPAELHTFLKTKAARENSEVRRLTVTALLDAYGAEFEQQKNK